MPQELMEICVEHSGNIFMEISKDHTQIAACSEETLDKETLPHSQKSENKTYHCCGHKLEIPADRKLEDFILVFIGSPGQKLTTFLMTLNVGRVITYDPGNNTAEISETKTSRLVMKRYFLVEKVKDANIVGILVGTLGIKDFKKVWLLADLNVEMKMLVLRMYLFNLHI